MLKFLKNWTLPIAMLIGALLYPLLSKLSFLTPALIFTMLLFTFCKISPKDLKIKPLYIWLLFLQILGSIAIYLMIAPFNKMIAEAALICVICPTATAAAVITGKLGGNSASLTTYTLLGNIGTAIAAPVIFPLIEVHPELSFTKAFFLISSKVFPLLICPFIAAWLLRIYLPKIHSKLLSYHEMAFYLWAISLTIVTAQTISSLIIDTTAITIKLTVAFVALVACCLQFYLGKSIGSIYDDRISGGQALGQKNTIFAIWMAHTYMDPISSIGPGSYVLWQNIINSWQLWKKRKNKSINRT